jgi:hypothetical protein
MGKYPIKLGCLPNSLSFPDVFRVSAFVFPQKRFYGFARLGTRAALLSLVFLFCQQKKEIPYFLLTSYYMHTFRRIYGEQNLFPADTKKNGRQKEI